MSRFTCLIIFSGSSALSIRSLRLARTNVETRSSNAMANSFFFFWLLALTSCSSHSCDPERSGWFRAKRTIRGVESPLPRDPALGSARHFHKHLLAALADSRGDVSTQTNALLTLPLQPPAASASYLQSAAPSPA